MIVVANFTGSRHYRQESSPFDTLEGMSAPRREDVSVRGESAADLLSKSVKKSSWVWARSALDEVKSNLQTTSYPWSACFS